MIFHDEEGVHMSEADYAELVKREIGPCGKHLKMFWVELCECGFQLKEHRNYMGDKTLPSDHEAFVLKEAYCKACREIEQAVAGAYEAAAQRLLTLASRRHVRFDDAGDAYVSLCTAAQEIRSLDSSAASRGKMAIREEALRALIQAVDEGEKAWQEGNCHEEGCGCITEHIKRAILSLIDKSGGK